MKNPDIRPKRVCTPRYAVVKAKKGKALNRWELEDLAKDAERSVQYAKITKKRFPEAEAVIAEHPSLAIEYAQDVIGGRFPEAEEQLIYSMENTYGGSSALSRYFIQHGVRDERVERYILKRDSSKIADYALKCVKGRWAEGEKTLLKERLDNAVEYHKQVVEGRWPELEDRILFKKGISYWDSPKDCFKNYLENIGGRSRELEEKLERTNRISLVLCYALAGAKGRLPPALHQKMMMLGFDTKKQKFAKAYFRFLAKAENRVVSYLAGLDDGERLEILAKARTK